MPILPLAGVRQRPLPDRAGIGHGRLHGHPRSSLRDERTFHLLRAQMQLARRVYWPIVTGAWVSAAGQEPSTMNERILKVDLHLHSDASRLKRLRFMRMRDCYSPPVEVYRRAKARGMDLVTLTDHDTIDGCLEVRERLGDPADFFMSEEVETFLPGDRSMHIGVFGI